MFSMAPAQNRLVILSHNPLVPILVPATLVEPRARTEPSRTAGEFGALTIKSKGSERTWEDTKGIAKLVLQIAHNCNLTCAYCISDAGRWGHSATSLMPSETAAEAVRFFAQHYHSIGTIYLFGGEPTLNLAAVEAVCDEAERLFDEGVLTAMPSIGMTSNGTIRNARLIRLLRDRPYFKLSVSLDGPPQVHDHFRLDTKGRPTYRRIVRNIQELRSSTGRPTSLEITYSKLHQDSGMSLWETLRLLHDDTGIDVIGVETAYNTSYSSLNFDPLRVNLDRTLEDAADAIAQSMRSIASSDDPIYHFHVIAFTQNLFRPHGPNFCPAGRSYFAIAGDGAVYPCQNLPETAETRIGYLREDQLLQKIAGAPIRKSIDRANEDANSAVGDQWFANFCKVCPVYNLSETKQMATTAPLRTKLYEAMASAYVKGLLEIARDDQSYEQFLTNVREEAESTLELSVV